VKRIFVDTSGWFAAASRKDHDHPAVEQYLKEGTRPLLTTDYVVDESATLFLCRLGHISAVRFLDSLQASPRIELIYLKRKSIEAAMRLFRERPDKGWSLTDCTSFVIMKEMGLDTALALDDHFRQAGFVTVPTGPVVLRETRKKT
jgi:predicted nucleic acid-binding protein